MTDHVHVAGVTGHDVAGTVPVVEAHILGLELVENPLLDFTHRMYGGLFQWSGPLYSPLWSGRGS